jgi:uncharacterized protein (TIGR03435 family)
MRACRVVSAIALVTLAAGVSAQSPMPGPVFDVVSIKQAALGPGGLPAGGRPIELPNGEIRLTGVPVIALLVRAYPGTVGTEPVGLPDWALRERYDVQATSTLARATPDDRAAMMRALLSERFNLVARVEPREQSVLALVPARANGSPGPGLKRIEMDCEAKRAADRAAAEAATAAGTPPAPLQPPAPNAAPPPCMMYSRAERDGTTRVVGEGTMADIATLMRLPLRTAVIDRTGWSGSYRIEMSYQMVPLSARPDAPPASGPEVSTALGEQLGLKLEAVRVARDTLVIDRMERPAGN